jgi:hypothetical protein
MSDRAVKKSFDSDLPSWEIMDVIRDPQEFAQDDRMNQIHHDEADVEKSLKR